MKHPFEYCALRYLLLWEEKERDLHAGMKNDPSVQNLRKSLQYFRVSRSFKCIGEEGKATLILNALRHAACDLSSSPWEKVMALATQFQTDFNKVNLSAASKLLWLTFRSPYIIYDSRAVKALKLLGCKFDERDYEHYYAEWLAKYGEHESQIMLASERLTKLQAFFAAWHQSEDSLSAITKERWFLERVFDYYLWELGDDQ